MPQRAWAAERQRPHQPVRPVTTLAGHHRPDNGNGHGRTYDELYEEAKRRNIKGRSKMSKTELERALG